MASWRDQLLEISGAMGLREIRRMRGEMGRAMFMRELEHWIKLAEGFAAQRFWPKATRFCFMCPFKTVCSRDPASQAGTLVGEFRVEDWDPTIDRMSQ